LTIGGFSEIRFTIFLSARSLRTSMRRSRCRRASIRRWAPRRCIVWDNRCTLRRATGFDEARLKRVMRRRTIVGDKPF
jgi:alpha-ketoglutarate-dependent taurine dioxygenase